MQLIHVIDTYKTDEDIQERLASHRLTPVIRLVRGDGTEIVATDIRGDRPDGTFNVSVELGLLNTLYAEDEIERTSIQYAIRGDYPGTSSRLRGENTVYAFDIDVCDNNSFNPFEQTEGHILCDVELTLGYETYDDFSYAFRHAAWLVALYAEPGAFVVSNKTSRKSHITPSERVAFNLLDRELENNDKPDSVTVTRVTYDETTNAVVCTRVEAKTQRHFEPVAPKH